MRPVFPSYVTHTRHIAVGHRVISPMQSDADAVAMRFIQSCVHKHACAHSAAAYSTAAVAVAHARCRLGTRLTPCCKTRCPTARNWTWSVCDWWQTNTWRWGGGCGLLLHRCTVACTQGPLKDLQFTCVFEKL